MGISINSIATNFEMAVSYGLAWAKLVKKNGIVGLGLVGSGLTKKQCKAVFKTIAREIDVELVSIEPEVMMIFKVK